MFCSSCHYNLQNLPPAPSPVHSPLCPECGHAFDPADPTTFLAAPPSAAVRYARPIVATLIILVLGLLAFLLFAFIRAAYQANLAEKRLQTTRLVCDLIAEHVESSPTRAWPTSWADLEKLPPRDSILSWPKDAAAIRAIITIDFTLTTSQVLSQSPQSCTAITLSPGPDYQAPLGWELTTLFDRLRAAAASTPPIPAPVQPSLP